MDGDDTNDRRWDDLADDLEAQVVAFEAVEDRAVAADVARAELAAVSMGDRLRGADDREVVLVVRGAGPVRGTVRGTGASWVLLDDGVRESLVPVAAILSVGGLGPSVSGEPGSKVEKRWGLGHVLRRHAHDRANVRVVLETGDVLTGTLDAVGADHVELAEHAAGEARRRDAVVGRRLVPFAAISLVARAAR